MIDMEPRYNHSPNFKGVKISKDFKELIKKPYWLPSHYVVSVKNAKDRRASIISKLIKNNLNYKIVDAYVPTDDLILNYYGKNKDMIFGKWGFGASLGGVVCCMASHFKALKEIIKQEDEIAVIIEDDILFRKDYSERIRQILIKYSETETFPNLITYTFSGGLAQGDQLIGDKINKCWSTIGYLITKKYAEDVIKTYDKTHEELDLILNLDGLPTALDQYGASSELIVMKSGGLICGVPLVIEDPRHESILGNIKLNWTQYGMENYLFE